MNSSDTPTVLVITAHGTHGRCIRDRLVDAAAPGSSSTVDRVGAR